MNQKHEEKFEGFIQLCKEAKSRGADAVVISHPSVIGDTYEELIENLSRLAESGLSLHVAGRF